MKQENNNQLSIEDVKKIIADIEDEERKESGFNGKIKTLTAIEYYKDSFKNKNFTLIKKIEKLVYPFTTHGIYSQEDSSVVIFMNSNNKILEPNKDLFNFILTCYHEIRHNLQDCLPIYSFNRFSCDIDKFIADYNKNIYKQKHDSFYFEIDSNNYSINKTKDYLKNKFPNIYNDKYIQETIESRKDTYSTDYALFDIGNSIEETTHLLRKHKLSIEKKEEISPILNIFFNKDNQFKSIYEIVSNENFINIDSRIICGFFSSKAFLDTIDFNSLEYYELDILYKSLEYMNNIYERQYKIIELEENNYKERLEFFLAIQKNIFKRISYLKSISTIIKVFKKRQSKSYRGHKLHKKKIPEYLEKTSSLLSSKKNNGFVIIDIFYIISFIISLGVVGYIILF